MCVMCVCMCVRHVVEHWKDFEFRLYVLPVGWLCAKGGGKGNVECHAAYSLLVCETPTLCCVRFHSPLCVLCQCACCVVNVSMCHYVQAFVGRHVTVPMSGGRTIPVIADDYVDMEFGTGALKITPGEGCVGVC